MVNSPHKKASNAENVSIWWRHHDEPPMIITEPFTTNFSEIWKKYRNQWNLKKKNRNFIQENTFRNVICKVSTILFWLQYVNSLWLSDTKWCQRSWSTLAHVMACCLMAPSHYLNQCWLNHPPPQKFHRKIRISFLDISFKITNLRLQPHLQGTNELKQVIENWVNQYVCSLQLEQTS